MGVDAAFYLKGSYTEKQKTDFHKAALERSLVDEYYAFRDYGDVVELRTLDRYYGEGYERGFWPSMYAFLKLAQHHFPEATLYYGSDMGEFEDADEITAGFYMEMWDYWLSADGMNYRGYSNGQLKEMMKKEPEVDRPFESLARDLIEDYVEYPQELNAEQRRDFERGYFTKMWRDVAKVRQEGKPNVIQPH